jgi:hypothetical protein
MAVWDGAVSIGRADVGNSVRHETRSEHGPGFLVSRGKVSRARDMDVRPLPRLIVRSNS